MARLIIQRFNTMKLRELLDSEQYTLSKEQKGSLMTGVLNDLHNFHYSHNEPYRKLTTHFFNDIRAIDCIEQLPFVPVGLFKKLELKSITDDKVFKVITSSGTTGMEFSKIFLNTETAQLQTLALAKIITHVLGNQRLPMIIVDSRSVLTDRNMFSARGAGILGLSVFGKDHFYLLDENFQPRVDELKLFLEKFRDQRILIFGFTFMVWQHLYSGDFPFPVDLGKGILIHSGGWKKLNEQAVDNEEYKRRLAEKFNLNVVYNFYGMAEQVGSVYLENGKGFLHCPNFSDIIIRNPVDFSVQPVGHEGLIQVVSVLPRSYPGHSILTEDIGVCMGEDDMEWKGKYFRILGRVKKADLRGCSDVYAN